jgi:hypothetical protein
MPFSKVPAWLQRGSVLPISMLDCMLAGVLAARDSGSAPDNTEGSGLGRQVGRNAAPVGKETSLEQCARAAEIGTI